MEELRSTEVLDREILEDARKKAYKILKTADDALEAQKRDWDKKIEDSLKSVRKTYAERTERAGAEILARLPLDKKRLRSESTERSLQSAMTDFLRSLKREQLLFIIEREIREHFEALALSEAADIAIPKARVAYSGLSLDETRALLKKATAASGSGKGAPVRINAKHEDWELKEEKEKHEFPFIVIDTRNWKLYASVEEAAASVLKDRRAELTAALLGEGALND